jgi:hypothetical protein
MSDTQVLDTVLQNSSAGRIRLTDDIGDITVNEDGPGKRRTQRKSFRGPGIGT